MWKRNFSKTKLVLVSTTALLFSQASFPLPEAPKNTESQDVQRFADTISLIKNYYVSPVKNRELFNQAIQGILIGLDAQATIVDKKNLVAESTDPNLQADPGLEITFDKGVIAVITPKLDSAAFKAGVHPGDYVIKIGSQSTQGLSIENAKELLQGKEGSSIKLVILRKGEQKPLVFNLIREKPSAVSVLSRLLDKQYGYVRISQFQQQTGKDMKEAIEKLQQQAGSALKGLILDLRYNPGGQLTSAVEVADAFVDNADKNQKMLLVNTQGRIPNLQYKAFASSGDILAKAPMIVLINKGSASAAEIVAGALRDNKRALTLGVTSAGQGSIQTLIPLDDSSVIKLTTALYVTPAGQMIQDKGITPDITVEALKLPHSPTSQAATMVREADLNNHLVSNANTADAGQKQELDALLDQDYQLYTAMSILKGRALIH